MSKDMTNEILKGVVACRWSNCKTQSKHFSSIKDSVGVGEHSDMLKPLRKEMEQIAHYDDIKCCKKTFLRIHRKRTSQRVTFVV